MAPTAHPLVSSAEASAWDTDMRLRELIDEHFAFIWRSLRRLGVTEAQADDASQQVWMVAARKLEMIAAGSERAFLFATAVRIASDVRRAARRSREDLTDDDRPPDAVDPGPTPDEALEGARARAELDAILGELPMELRVVFVLFEIEELSSTEIAALISIPPGTVASRLRRARQQFTQIAQRRRARTRGGVVR